MSGAIPFAMSTGLLSMLILLMQRIDSYFTDCVGFETASRQRMAVWSEVRSWQVRVEWIRLSESLWKTRSGVWPRPWVGPLTVCTRLNISTRSRNFLVLELLTSSKWIFKSPAIIILFRSLTQCSTKIGSSSKKHRPIHTVEGDALLALLEGQLS